MSHNDEAILAALTQASGDLVDETGIYFEGNRRVIPETFKSDPLAYVTDLHQAILALEEHVKVQRTLTYRPWDTAVILERTFKDMFGMSLSSLAGSGNSVQVTLDHKGTTMSVPWGRFKVGFLKGTLQIGADYDNKYGLVTVITIVTPLRHRSAAEAFLNMIVERMSVESIYRGQAISGGETAEFRDTTKLDPADVIYPDSVKAQLEAHIWSRIRYREQLTADGIDFKRAVIVYGPWGTGKTLVGDLTSRIAVENGVTYIYGRVGDSLAELMQTARLYQPAVVFVEDVDNLPAGSTEEIAQLLELFDGLDAKHKDVMVVMTTNHIENIPKGMLRPGRLDALIHIEHMDDDAREKFVRHFVPAHLIDPDLDMAPINVAMEGYVAAYVKASVQDAIWYARSENGGEAPTVITTQNLVHAAEGLRGQYDLHVNAQEGRDSVDLGSVLRDTIAPTVNRAAQGAAMGIHEHIDNAVLNYDTMTELVAGQVDNVMDGAAIIDRDGDRSGNIST